MALKMIENVIPGAFHKYHGHIFSMLRQVNPSNFIITTSRLSRILIKLRESLIVLLAAI